MQNAYTNMIDNQIRAGDIHVQSVFDTISVIKREEFVPASFYEYAFADMEIPLPYGQNMLTPRIEAHVLQAITLSRKDIVLEIGTGSGHMAALLANRARHVTTVEFETGLKQIAENNLKNQGIKNIKVIENNGFLIDEYAKDHLFDVIVFSGASSNIPDNFMHHLSVNGRLIAFVGNNHCIKAILLQKCSETDIKTTILFETFIKPLKEQPHYSYFCF